ncbi:hypothetical protein [Rhodoferax sp.]|uniref:hypothetical protein n=1 Tax=Rhodoferax sp. TaxID=50421 RepID=UPI0025CE094A|nr:hypothetical protein [Rhodoferax sp.]
MTRSFVPSAPAVSPTPLPRPQRPQRPASLTQWEALVQRGTHAVQAGHPELALFSFHQALAIAQDLLDVPPAELTDDCLAALVVSHHNLADLYAQAQLLEAAAQHLCRAHRTLLALQHSPAHGLAWRHSRETHTALLLHQRAWGPHPDITALLHATTTTLASPGTLH